MNKPIHGIVHGKTIEFDEDIGIADGQQVEVRVQIVQPAQEWGQGILRSAGAWEKYPEMDAIMEQIYQKRKLERRSERVSE